jgi:mercuric ion transport protein
MKVELIYDRDCPNVADARRNLMRAMQVVGAPVRWTEWERSSPDSCEYVRGFGSPTVLIDGVDMAGDSPGRSPCCRIYQASSGGRRSGVPPVEMIAAGLRRAGAAGARPCESAGGLRSSVLALPAILVSLLPTLGCPLCWPGYAALLSSLGLGLLASSAYLFPIVAVLLAVAVGALAYGAGRRRRYGAFALSVTATAIILTGKFGFGSTAAAYVGVALLVTASLLNVFGRSSDLGGLARPGMVPAGLKRFVAYIASPACLTVKKSSGAAGKSRWRSRAKSYGRR